MFNLEPADIVLTISTGEDLFSRVKRWAIGPAFHVFMYMGRLVLLRDGYSGEVFNVPMIFESNGRGVVLGSLSRHYGEQVIVMRITESWELYTLPSTHITKTSAHLHGKKGYWTGQPCTQYREHIPQLLNEAIKLAGDPQAYYDYLCVARSIIPRIIYEKLGVPLWLIPEPLKYKRDLYQICSEAILEISIRAGIPLLRDDIVPLPGDFFNSPKLRLVWAGELSDEKGEEK